MNNPDHISESLEAIFELKFFDTDPGSWMEKFEAGIRIRNTRVSDPNPYPDPH
jgi:hypothetical protein